MKTTKSNSKVLSKELFDSTGNLFESVLSSTKLSQIQIAKYRFVWDVYTSRLLKYAKTRGLVDTVKLFKELKRISTCIATHEEYQYLPTRNLPKSSGGNYPRLLNLVVPLLKSKKLTSVRVGLTVVGVVNSLHLPVDNDFSQIEGPSTATNLDQVEKLFKAFIDHCEFLPRFGDADFCNRGSVNPYLSFKNGPNGPSAISFPLDQVALRLDPQLEDKVLALLAVTNPSVYDLYLEQRSKEDQPVINYVVHHSKVVQLSEKGGKTRKIAIIDGWSQSALKPIHKLVFSILKSLETDGTYDQDKSFKDSVRLANELSASYSYDLSSATDRFPLSLQKIVVDRLFGPLVGDLWSSVIADRVFVTQLPDSLRTLCWSVGQPLGALSSWGIFTLTHHLFIRYCAGDPTFDSYRILGDDVQLFNTEVAQSYLKTMKSCGVEISLPKSFVTQGFVHGEFCKRIYSQNNEISPIPFGILKSCSEDVNILPMLFDITSKRWGIPLTELCLRFKTSCHNLPPKFRRSAIILAGFIESMERNFISYPLDLVFNDLDDLNFQILKGLETQFIKFAQELAPEIDDEYRRQELEDPFTSQFIIRDNLLQRHEDAFVGLLDTRYAKSGKPVRTTVEDSNLNGETFSSWLWSHCSSRQPSEPLFEAVSKVVPVVKRLVDTYIFSPKEFRNEVQKVKYLPDLTLVSSFKKLSVVDPKDTMAVIANSVVRIFNRSLRRSIPKQYGSHYFELINCRHGND